MYKCFNPNCGRKFDKFGDSHWRCPYCGHRAVIKLRPEGVIRRVKAI